MHTPVSRYWIPIFFVVAALSLTALTQPTFLKIIYPPTDTPRDQRVFETRVKAMNA